MLRKFLIPTVIVSILLLLTTLITIAKTEVASVVTSTTATSVTTAATPTNTTVKIQIPTIATITPKTTSPRQRKITIIHAQAANSKGTRVIHHGRKNTQSNKSKSNSSRSNNTRITSGNGSNSDDISNNNTLLLNNAEETTTSLLPLQPTLSVTSTTLATLISDPEQGQLQQHQIQQHTKVKQHQPQKSKEKQKQQHQEHQPEQPKRQNRQQIQDVAEATTTPTTTTTQQSDIHLINTRIAPTENDSEMEKSNKDSPEVLATVELVTPTPTNTNAYIPFELDYNDPTEEKARPPEVRRQSTINEVLSSLFPIGFSNIFRFSYAAEPTAEENPPVTVPPNLSDPSTTSKAAQIPITIIKSTPIASPTTTVKATQTPIVVIKSTPMPFKPMPTEKVEDKIRELGDLVIAPPFKPMPTSSTNTKSRPAVNTTTIENGLNSTQIVVEKILADLATGKSSEEFRDGSNSISKDELLRINRAAKQSSVLPSLLLKPQEGKATNETENKKPIKAIVILNDNDNDDFVEAPEDDNQIAESQNIAHGVYQTPPPESISYQQDQNQNINVHIVHDDTMKKLQFTELQNREKGPKVGAQPRDYKSYQSFVEQAKFLHNSLQESPSRKFLKNFNPTLTRGSNPFPVSKGNFHYEHRPESHIQTVPPAAQLQYFLYHRPQQQQQQQQQEGNGKPDNNNQQIRPQPQHRSTPEGVYGNSEGSETHRNKENGNPVHYITEIPHIQSSDAQPNYQTTHEVSKLHTRIIDSGQLNDKNTYQTVDSDNNEPPQSATPINLVFVTINTPEAPLEVHHSQQQPARPSKAPVLGLSKPFKTPADYVHEAINVAPEQVPDHQPEETENNPKSSVDNSGKEGGGGYTFVEIQKSINIHNKLITEKDGHLVEQHETIYPPVKYGEKLERKPYFQQASHQQQEPHNYVSLSQNPILVESLEQHEPAESLHAIQHALDPSQSLVDIGTIQQSNLIQESHIVETPIPEGEQYHPEPQNHQEEHHHVEQHQHVGQHDLPEPSQNPDQPPVQIPYALPLQDHSHSYQHHYQHPLILQEVIEKHVHIPYAVQEPVPYPVAVQHFIDRPVPVETIVEKPIPYPVEKVVEKIVEKHVPIHVEKIVEKPVEKIVEKYIDRPIAVPIKIPVALQVTQQNSPYSPYFPSSFGGTSPSIVGPWSQQPSLTRIPTKVLQSYYNKMLKKLVPQMTQAYKTSPLASKPKTVAKHNPKLGTMHAPKTGDMRFDLKPPPPPALGSSWDVGARYQYDYNTLPLDLSASSSTAVGKQSERPGPVFKTNFDEFQRWRNGHSLKRSPEFGMNLHVEYGFKPPLVPSVEIDDKGMPLKAASDLTKGKEE